MSDTAIDTGTPEEAPSVLEVSDEDFLKMDIPSEAEIAPVEDNLVEADSGIENTEIAPESDDTPSKEEVIDEPIPPTENIETELEPEEVKIDSIPKEDPISDTNSTSEDDKTVKPDTSTDVNYASIGEQVMAEFKANGQSMKMKSAEDVITLMQMGANYQKKMVGLKPSLKILKLLQKHDLINPEKINYLIDLHNSKPEAVTKLLKDSKIDPLDVDVQAETTYKPDPNSGVADAELVLDSVLEGIQDSPKYQDTLNVITDVWDDASRDTIATNPNIISVINGHMESGIYDKVMQAVNYERSLGKLVNMSDIDAYKHVGDILQEQGQLTTPSQETITAPTDTTNVAPAKDNAANIAALKKRKQAVSPTKNTSTPAQKDYNPLSMSDEDFLKIENKKF